MDSISNSEALARQREHRRDAVPIEQEDPRVARG